MRESLSTDYADYTDFYRHALTSLQARGARLCRALGTADSIPDCENAVRF